MSRWSNQALERLVRDLRHRAEYDPDEMLRVMVVSNRLHNFDEYEDPRLMVEEAPECVTDLGVGRDKTEGEVLNERLEELEANVRRILQTFENQAAMIAAGQAPWQRPVSGGTTGYYGCSACARSGICMCVRPNTGPRY